MKKIYRDKIINIPGTDIFDQKFLIEYMLNFSPRVLNQPLPQPLSKRGEHEVFQNNLSQVNHRLPYNKELSERRKELKNNLTWYEKQAWSEFLSGIQKQFGVRILQQRIIGNFIVDFYIASLGMVIEIDGESHFNEQGLQYDKERTGILEGYGLKVIRYTNDEIKNNLEGIKEQFIKEHIPLSWRGVRGECIMGAENDVEIIYMKDVLEVYKNEEILKKTNEKPAMWSEMYSPKDELKIFTELFEKALEQKKKIHIVGITLGEEVQMLEEYYEELGFMREDINAFDVDFSIPLVTASCHIENLMWRGSDYKAQRDKIFFCPPIRESGQNKAIFKGITRGVIAGIELGEFTSEKQQFIGDCIRGEKILPLYMGKVLKYNLEEVGMQAEVKELQIVY